MRESISRKDLPRHIADVGLRACYEFGVTGVGMAEIAERAQVSKRTLYRHFPDKLSLVEAGLRARSDRWIERLRRELPERAGSPRGRLIALFDLLAEDVLATPFLGCYFVNATAQTAASDPTVRRLTQWHKKRLHDEVRTLADSAGARDPDLLAGQLMLLVEGALASAAVSATDAPVRLAGATATQLIDQAVADTKESNA
ncbi:TetR family transcriptional regulator [Herbihabitans rhizosphaerae]|uniref:TetR family transcriptional regulator n=1 Tax=Herbihabitans rhizosphaerae TaxID=1872711 RepID=A0A4V2ER83_9PSEU|nr:TetR/AcrR family transcriptional regulator [Herbihabitans rhizosphaerae]RZS29551.1 TetR family transcriptional regulator [Herbihabitans rhizosphaerae]